jgi:hypothetical protein
MKDKIIITTLNKEKGIKLNLMGIFFLVISGSIDAGD